MEKRMNAPAGEVGFNGWHRSSVCTTRRPCCTPCPSR
jgi:hypothetical protein